jgi:3-deoxy-manno-octulosonate cytidylyltransferase (CMP-KDO synthetase)
MTDPNCTSGTDRIASLTYSQIERDDIVVNWQGDLPFADARIADQLFDLMQDKSIEMATASNLRSVDDDRYDSPHTVKVSVDPYIYATGFSRKPEYTGTAWLHHFGMYAYRVPTLQKIYKTPQTDAEKREGLEQLRAMSLGIPIKVLVTQYEPGIEINTAEDLEAIYETV